MGSWHLIKIPGEVYRRRAQLKAPPPPSKRLLSSSLSPPSARCLPYLFLRNNSDSGPTAKEMTMRYAMYTATLALAMAVAGCAQSPNVPPTASSVATGGKDVSYTAPRDGKIYLQD